MKTCINGSRIKSTNLAKSLRKSMKMPHPKLIESSLMKEETALKVDLAEV